MSAATDPRDWGARLDDAADELLPKLREVRRHLHRHPEPSGEEVGTTVFLREALVGEGVEVREGPGGCGLVVDGGSEPGSKGRVAWRGDIDALRLHDLKTVDYRSEREGVMHACGHDAHATCALGAIWLLKRLEREGALPWPVAWRAILQPAEETATGALEMVEAGALDGVGAIFSLHADPTRDVGQVGLRDGALTAACDWIEVKVEGRGGHAARPHESTDPIAAAAQLISSIYAFIPRAVDSHDPVVVTIGKIDGGYNANVIPESLTLAGTMRTLSEDVRRRAQERMRELVEGFSKASGCEIDVEFTAGLAAVMNDPGANAVLRRAATGSLGVENVEEIERPSMGGEDFAAYGEKVPAAMMRLGVRSEGVGNQPLHSPLFDIDERALAIGARVLARAAILWSAT